MLYLYRCLQILIAENGGCVKKAGNGAIFCKIRASGATACVAVVYARSCAEWLSNAIPSCCKQALVALQTSLVCTSDKPCLRCGMRVFCAENGRKTLEKHALYI